MRRPTARFNICDLLLIFLVIGVIFSNYIWLKIDRYPAEGHNLLGVIPSIQIYNKLKSTTCIFAEEFRRIFFSHIYNMYPPLSFFILVLYYLLFGPQGQMVVMINSIYIIMTLLSVYLIGKEMFDRRMGLLSAFLLSSFPGFIAFSRVYWIEFGLMAYVSLAIYFLLRTNFFENRKYSILSGIFLSLAFLHKYESIAFVIGPFMLMIYKSEALKDILRARCSKRATNFILALASTFPAFWWGWLYRHKVLERIYLVVFSSLKWHVGQSDILLYGQRIRSLESLTFYLRSIASLVENIFLIFFFLSLFFSIIRIIKEKNKRVHILYLALWFLFPYIIFTACVSKGTSHILSILPAIAILMSVAVYLLKNRLVQTIVIGFLIINGLFQHLHLFFGLVDSRSIYLMRIFNALNRSKLEPIFCRGGAQAPPFYPPRKEELEFAIKEILGFIKSEPYKKETSRVLVVWQRYNFNNAIFDYYSLIENYPFEFNAENTSHLSELDFIIIECSEGQPIAEILSRDYLLFDNERANFKKIFQNGIGDFNLIKIYKIPNGNTSAYIYKRRELLTRFSKIS